MTPHRSDRGGEQAGRDRHDETRAKPIAAAAAPTPGPTRAILASRIPVQATAVAPIVRARIATVGQAEPASAGLAAAAAVPKPSARSTTVAPKLSASTQRIRSRMPASFPLPAALRYSTHAPWQARMPHAFLAIPTPAAWAGARRHRPPRFRFGGDERTQGGKDWEGAHARKMRAKKRQHDRPDGCP